MKVNGKNQQDALNDPVLTGQVPVESLPGHICRLHRAVAHDAEGSVEKVYCNRCGKNDAGAMLGRPNGGWA